MTSTAKLALIGLVGAALSLGGSVGEAQSFRMDPNQAKRGKSVWMKNGCYVCHGHGRKLAAPDLVGVTTRRDPDWLRQFLKDTPLMLMRDTVAKAMLAEWQNVKMPQFKLNDSDVDALINFLAQDSEAKGS
jgi:cytochrome c551/c552